MIAASSSSGSGPVSARTRPYSDGERSPHSAHSSSRRNGATAGCATSGTSSPATEDGTPATASARRSAGRCRSVDRTITAISRHGTPSSRCAARSRWATYAASSPAVRSACTSTRPGGVPRTGRRSRCAAGPGSRAAIRRLNASSVAPDRRDAPSATTGTGCPDAGANTSGNRRIACGSEPRNA